MCITLDAAALIAVEKNDRRVIAALRVAVDAGRPITVPAGVVGQLWRDGTRQACLAPLLGSSGVPVEELDDAGARAAGQLCGIARTNDDRNPRRSCRANRRAPHSCASTSSLRSTWCLPRPTTGSASHDSAVDHLQEVGFGHQLDLLT